MSGYALITGASRGIGAAFAEALVAEGRNLVLSARSAGDLENLRQRLSRPGIDIACLSADLNQGAGALLRELAARGLAVDLLVNNAGLGSGGAFAELPLERELEEVRVNVAALVELSRGCLAGMRTRGGGAIINVASTAAFQAVPYMATYAASKAFVLSFSLALYEEMRRQGVHVMALCPGPTDTGFFAAAAIRPLAGPLAGGMASPREVVAQGLRGLRARRPLVVCGARNRALIAAERLLPRPALAALVARMMASWRLAKP